MTLVAALAAAGSVGAFLVGPVIVRLFFGASYGLGRLDLLYLAAASGAYMLAVVFAQGLIALHGHGLAAAGWLIGVVVHLVVTAVATGLLVRVELGFLAGATTAAGTLAVLLRRRCEDRLRGVENFPAAASVWLDAQLSGRADIGRSSTVVRLRAGGGSGSRCARTRRSSHQP
jgi:O-antigen/teichoic acid export membrane protein